MEQPRTPQPSPELWDFCVIASFASFANEINGLRDIAFVIVASTSLPTRPEYHQLPRWHHHAPALLSLVVPIAGFKAIALRSQLPGKLQGCAWGNAVWGAP